VTLHGYDGVNPFHPDISHGAVSVPNPYFSYLLRLWRTNNPAVSEWRISIEDPHSREMRGFNSPQLFWKYLQNLMEEDAPPGQVSKGEEDPDEQKG
jgi:hypothetical protein